VVGFLATVDFIFFTVDVAAFVAHCLTFAIIAISHVRNNAPPTISVDFLKWIVFIGIDKK
jgi:hypothetical protein